MIRDAGKNERSQRLEDDVDGDSEVDGFGAVAKMSAQEW
jgi:hypothetical protein